MALARAFGLLDRPDVSLLSVEPATDSALTLVHSPDYLDAVRRAGETMTPDPAHGLGTMDDPLFRGMHEATSLVAGATLAAAQAVHEGRHDHAVNVAGGLHHAMASAASRSEEHTSELQSPVHLVCR